MVNEEAKKFFLSAKNSYYEEFFANLNDEQLFSIFMSVLKVVDDISYGIYFSPYRPPPVEKCLEERRRSMHRGFTGALLELVKRLNASGGIYDSSITAQSIRTLSAEKYLFKSGLISYFQRLFSLSKRGFAQINKTGEKEFLFRIVPEKYEAAFVSLARNYTKSGKIELPASVEDVQDAKLFGEIIAAVSRVDSLDDWHLYVRRVPQFKEFFLREAKRFSRRYYEREDLPSDSQIRGSRFGEWMNACELVCSHILISFLYKKNTSRKTGFDKVEIIKRDVLFERLLEDGIEGDFVQEFVMATSGTLESLEKFESEDEVSLPFFIFLSESNVFLSAAALANPFLNCVRYLQSFKDEWNNCARAREDDFRRQLAKIFENNRFSVLERGRNIPSKIKSKKGTDIDAIIVDKKCKEVILLQIKDLSTVGSSVRVFANQRSSVYESNTWIDSVLNRFLGQEPAHVYRSMGLKMPGLVSSPVIWVVARGNAKFTSTEGSDSPSPMASWLSIYEIMYAFERFDVQTDPVSRLVELIDEYYLNSKNEQLHECSKELIFDDGLKFRG